MGARLSAAAEPLLQDGADPETAASATSPPDAPVTSPHAKLSVTRLSREVESGPAILRSVSLEVPSGSIAAVIGPSGSGKSTLLRALNRLWEPAHGTVFLDGADVTALSVLLLRRRVGMLFQKPTLFDGTVADNVRYGPGLAGRALSDQQVGDLLAQADLDRSFAPKPVTTLSGGQAQRVALAQTLANGPEVLLLDEPTSALDPAATLAIEGCVRSLVRARGLTAVWVSHSVDQVLRVADSVHLLVDGSLVDSFPPSELRSGKHQQAVDFVDGRLRSRRSLTRPPEGEAIPEGETAAGGPVVA